MKKIKKPNQDNFPVGFFFTILSSDRRINQQGLVEAKSGDVYVVRFFSWIDGYPCPRVEVFSKESMKEWRWYTTDRDMIVDINRINGGEHSSE